MSKFFLLLVTYFCFQSIIMGQHSSLESKIITGNKAYNTKFIGVDNNGFAYALAKRGGTSFFFSNSLPWIQVFDIQSRRLVAEKSISDLAINKRGFNFVEFSILNNAPLLIISKKDKSKNINYFAVEIDQEINLLGNPFNIGRMPICSISERDSLINPETRLVHYKDPRGYRTFITSQRCYETDTLKYMRVTLSDNNLEIYRNTFSLPIVMPKRQGKIITYNDKLYLALSAAPSAEYRFYNDFMLEGRQSHFFTVNSFGSVHEINLKLTEDLFATDLQFNRKRDKIYVSGQVISSDFGMIKGLFTAELNTVKDELEQVKIHLFELDFISRFWSAKNVLNRDSERDKVESNSIFKLVEHLSMDDGGEVYFIQKNYTNRARYRQENTHSGVRSINTFHRYYYHYTDLIILKINENKEPVWTQNIPLYNIFAQRDPGKGIVTAQKGNNIYVLHAASNEVLNAINTGSDLDISSLTDREGEHLVLTKIEHNGNIQTNQILNLNNIDLRFWPKTIGVDHVRNRFFLFHAPKSKLKKNATTVYTVSF